jgi:integrase
MAARRDSCQWRYRKVIQLEDGRRIRISGTPAINTKLEAEAAERAHILRVLRPSEAKKEVPKFKEFAAEFLRTYVAANNKPSEQAAKESILRVNVTPAFGRLRLDEITVREVEAFKAKLLEKELTPKTINNNLTVLSRLLGYAVEIGILPNKPRVKFIKVMAPRLDFLDFEELERLIESGERDPDVRCAILVGAEAGLRAGEIRALECSDVDLKLGASRFVRRTGAGSSALRRDVGRARSI